MNIINKYIAGISIYQIHYTFYSKILFLQTTESSYISPDIMETRLGANKKETKMRCLSCLHHQMSTECHVVTAKRTEPDNCCPPNNMGETCQYQHNNISNSSLQDVDHEELQRELSLFMRDVSNRHRNRYNQVCLGLTLIQTFILKLVIIH